MRPRVADTLTQMLNETPDVRVILEHYEGELAEWLRGDQMRLQSLVRFLLARIESRGFASAPSNSHESTRKEAMDAECRAIVSRLRELHLSPVINDDVEVDNG